MNGKAVSLVFNLTEGQIRQLADLYANEFWSKGRKPSDIARMLASSDLIIGAVDDKHRLVGFVRVLTDYVYKAVVFDLIVHRRWRRNGIGRLLMDTVIGHPELCDVQHFDLNCLPDMYAFYAKWDFTSDVGPLGFMRRFDSGWSEDSGAKTIAGAMKRQGIGST